MKITFIGGGNMGEAIVSAILKKRLSRPQSITVSDISQTRLQSLEQKYGVSVTADNRLAIAKAEVILLAIKPQSLAELLPELNGQLKLGQLVLSIIAGVNIGTLRRGLGHNRIVRAMPNTPAQIGEGISIWTSTPEVTETQKRWAGSILSAVGQQIYVDDEKYLNMATAVNGSGPAYFFLFIEALVAASEHIGLPADIAQQLVVQTMLGSGHLLLKSGKGPAELRQMVTSKGGTTAAALAEFERGEFNNLVKRAISAAYKRAKELGGEQ